MVLRPVDKLVEASRKYIHDHFDYRANLDQKDEFLEMADAYNRLAERVQSAERQRLEMVAQVAVTLNHELNNAMATIEMQLQLLASQSGSGEKYQAPLRQIRENLRRMAATVASLKHIRRIVLTEYISGTQMLDLQRSVEDKPAELHQAGAAEGPP